MDFGTAMRQLVGEYRSTFARVVLVWHVSTLDMLYLTLRYSNRYRRAFS